MDGSQNIPPSASGQVRRFCGAKFLAHRESPDFFLCSKDRCDWTLRDPECAQDVEEEIQVSLFLNSTS